MSTEVRKREVRKVIDRIKFLEKEKAKLLPLRKEEIFNILKEHNGLTIDNHLLAGLAIHVSDPANAKSELLKELGELGRKATPSKRTRTSPG